jgi:hypothetical protein
VLSVLSSISPTAFPALIAHTRSFRLETRATALQGGNSACAVRKSTRERGRKHTPTHTHTHTRARATSHKETTDRNESAASQENPRSGEPNRKRAPRRKEGSAAGKPNPKRAPRAKKKTTRRRPTKSSESTESQERLARRRQAKSNESTQNQKKQDAPQASQIEREHAASQQVAIRRSSLRRRSGFAPGEASGGRGGAFPRKGHGRKQRPQRGGFGARRRRLAGAPSRGPPGGGPVPLGHPNTNSSTPLQWDGAMAGYRITPVLVFWT